MEGTYFVFWNWLVAVYLFVAGVSAGCFAVSAIAYFIGPKVYQDISRIGAYIAPFPLLVGIACLIADLERPLIFWKLMLTLQVASVMSWGAWLLLIFSALSFIYFYLWLPERFDLVNLFKKPADHGDDVETASESFLYKLRRRNLKKLKGWIALIGLPVALMVGIYTGVLLGALVARPFWNNPMLPMLFLVSALKTGTASICLYGCFIQGFGGMSQEKMETNKFLVHSLDFVLMVLAIITIFLFIFGLYVSPRSSVGAALLIMGGPYTFAFWGLVVVLGIFIPLCLEIYELLPHFIRQAAMREHNPWISGIITIAVLIGGYFLRHVVVYGGQAAELVSL
ncbi:MAG: polysulfide reductase NrfD [Syntrophales bacterium]|nr:polysulfide reductase NrfD [Syntrophales bacterium]